LRVLRIFGRKAEEVQEGWWKVHSDDRNLIIRMMKLGRVRYVRRVARMGENIIMYTILVAKLEETTLRNLCGYGWWIILKRILHRMGGFGLESPASG
jgi:hypothetical protein